MKYLVIGSTALLALIGGLIAFAVDGRAQVRAWDVAGVALVLAADRLFRYLEHREKISAAVKLQQARVHVAQLAEIEHTAPAAVVPELAEPSPRHSAGPVIH